MPARRVVPRDLTETTALSERTEVRPIKACSATIEERLEKMAERGVVVRHDGPRTFLSPLTRQPGALQRFLSERDG